MQRIHPITEESCRPHCGKPVLVILADGTEIQGVLSRVDGGKLYLNDEGGDEATLSSKKAKIKSVRTRNKSRKARKSGGVTAVPPLADDPVPGPYGHPAPFLGPLLVFDLAFIAALFVLI
jgi:hypothetical protein